jgi:hypothetical protein
MNPNEYYRLKSAEIKEADIRLVAACMSDHVGEEHRKWVCFRRICDKFYNVR